MERLTWADDVEDVEVVFDDCSIEMSVNECETWACTPVTEETILDVVWFKFSFQEDVIFQENHS